MSQTQRIAETLHAGSIHLLRWVRLADAESGLSPARLSALSVLVFGGPQRIGRLAQIEQVRLPTMTRLVQGLESEGLVERRSEPEDGRVAIIAATAKGLELMERARQRRLALLVGMLDGLDNHERETLSRAGSILKRVF